MTQRSTAGATRRLPVVSETHPRYVVWELTLACDQRCTHCGSRAAVAREAELTAEEALAVIEQLRAAGTREIALIGGEAYLHPGFLEIIRTVIAAGIRCSLTTGGRGVTAELASKMHQAGLYSASVSVDGLQETHDLLRANRGGYGAALAALGHLREAGITVGCNTVVNRLNVGELEPLYEVLKGAGIRGWQVQLAAALGRAADRPAMLLQPWELLDLVPRIARLKERAFSDGILLTPGNNVGYFSLDENLLRSLEPQGRDHWMGCQAGRASMGLESDGAVKGCPSLQTDTYVGGNVRSQPIAEIWGTEQLAFTRQRSIDELWGFCRECPFGDTCFGGCTFTAHAFFGRPGNNPYCHFRAKTLAARGQRERLVPKERAPGRPFDNGRFELVLEPFDAPDPVPARREALLKVWTG
jgi:radical SAM protein with 4Fe4S-binding SPASM domain